MAVWVQSSEANIRILRADLSPVVFSYISLGRFGVSPYVLGASGVSRTASL